jgi:hypothetical protein
MNMNEWSDTLLDDKELKRCGIMHICVTLHLARRIAHLEPFDEYAALALHGKHYAVGVCTRLPALFATALQSCSGAVAGSSRAVLARIAAMERRVATFENYLVHDGRTVLLRDARLEEVHSVCRLLEEVHYK